MIFNLQVAHTAELTEQTRCFIDETSVGRFGSGRDRNRYRKKVLNNDRHDGSGGS